MASRTVMMKVTHQVDAAAEIAGGEAERRADQAGDHHDGKPISSEMRAP